MTVIEYRFKNIQPVIVKDENVGDNNQIDTIRYIPGSSVRGFVISRMDKPFFDANKKELLSDKVRFLNAYPIIKDEISVPSPKNYYASKAKPDDLTSILEAEKSDDSKRAGLGDFCIMNNDTISCISVKLGDSLNNNVGEREIFRSRYIAAGQCFGGYIVVDENEEAAKKIADIMNSKDMHFGGYISHGFGKCEGTARVIDKMPYEKYRCTRTDSVMKLMLLSDTLMKDEYGEPCGLNMDCLREKLGSFDIIMCSSSVRPVGGRNRTWNCNIPVENMYEKGSIFLLKFDKAPDMSAVEEIENKGLGIRRGEGFGQVVFTGAVPKTAIKETVRDKAEDTTDNIPVGKDKDMLMALAAKYYRKQISMGILAELVEPKEFSPYKKLSRSQAGKIRSMAQRLKYEADKPEKIHDEFREFFDKNQKKAFGKRHIYGDVEQHINDVFDWNKFTKMIKPKENKTYFGMAADTLLSENEKIIFQLDFIEREIQLYHKRGEER